MTTHEFELPTGDTGWPEIEGDEFVQALYSGLMKVYLAQLQEDVPACVSGVDRPPPISATAPRTLLNLLLDTDTAFGQEERVVAVLFHPLIDYLPQSALLVEIRIFMQRLHDDLLAGHRICIPCSSWCGLFSFWYRGAITLNAQHDCNFGTGLTIIHDFFCRIENFNSSGTISGGEYDQYPTDLMEFVCDQRTLELPKTATWLAHFLLKGYVPARLLR